MQRKNNFLMPQKLRRDGFAMIMAIIVVVIIGGLMAFSLSLVSNTTKRTTDLYLYEQTVLYSKSAAERALLDIAQTGSCTVIGPYTIDGIYNVNVNVKYIYKGLVCGDIDADGVNDDYFTTLQTDEQNGSVLMDITVTTNEGTEPIRYFRRVMQKL